MARGGPAELPETMSARNLVRETGYLLPDDSLGRAVERLRAGRAAALPVLSGGIVVGLVSEEDLMRHLAAAGDPELVRTTPVSALMQRPVICLAAGAGLEEAAKAFTYHDLAVAPLVDEFGRYQGLVTRADVLAARFGAITPARIGGLATPLGVYLTTGLHRGGAGHLGLVLAGAVMALLFAAAALLANGAAWLVQHFTGYPVLTAKLAQDHGTSLGLEALYPAVLAVWAVQVVAFFALLRLSPLSGTHAAEHQTVHAIERGEELTPERVSQMPRVHPRCGTNLMALLMLGSAALVAGFDMVSAFGPAQLEVSLVAFLGAVLAVSATWRRVGSGLQRYITTKKATPRQIANGIAAGKELLERYRAHPVEVVPLWRRLLGTGIIQMALGLLATVALLDLLSRWLALGLGLGLF